MNVFKEEHETKRVIFNLDGDLALRLEKAKAVAKKLGKKLNVDAVVDEAVSTFLVEAEKQLARIERDTPPSKEDPIVMGPSAEDSGTPAETTALQIRKSSVPDAAKPRKQQDK